MKKIIFRSVILFAVFLTSCAYDNYDAPDITYNGKLVYNGNNLLFDGNPDRGVITLIQKGFGKIDGGTNVRIDEHGAFTQLIFPGDYLLTLANNKYPFEFKDFKSLGSGIGYDTIPLKITANTTKDFEVTPYFQIKDYTATVVDGNIVVNFNVSKTEGTLTVAPNVVRARCFVSTSSIVNSATVCSKSKIISITDSGAVSISVSVSVGDASYRKIYKNNFRDYAFCRVSLELNGISNYYLFSETIKVEGLPQ